MKRAFVLAASVVSLSGCFESEPKIIVSSVSNNLNGYGLLESKSPGWHAESPPAYPQFITLNFSSLKTVGSLGLKPQDGWTNRFAKAVRIETSEDGVTWKPIAGSDDICKEIENDGWVNLSFNPVKTKKLKVMIFSNCDGGDLLTIQGVKVGEQK